MYSPSIKIKKAVKCNFYIDELLSAINIINVFLKIS